MSVSPNLSRRQAVVLLAVATLTLLFPGLTMAEPKVSRIDVYPPDVQLNTSLDRQRLLVVATREDGVTKDVTAETKLTLDNGDIARLEGPMLLPTGDGSATLKADYAGHSAAIPVTVVEAKAPRPISFKLDVMPVFMRAGCNTGSCHGSARGQDGFHLSLFGYDPDSDYHSLTREIGFRRINLALPRESLLLEKSIGAVPHTGGKRFEPDSEYYKTF